METTLFQKDRSFNTSDPMFRDLMLGERQDFLSMKKIVEKGRKGKWRKGRVVNPFWCASLDFQRESIYDCALPA